MPLKVFDQIDSGVEFTRNDFKTRRHPESGSELASPRAITVDGLVVQGNRANAAAARAKGRD